MQLNWASPRGLHSRDAFRKHSLQLNLIYLGTQPHTHLQALPVNWLLVSSVFLPFLLWAIHRIWHFVFTVSLGGCLSPMTEPVLQSCCSTSDIQKVLINIAIVSVLYYSYIIPTVVSKMGGWKIKIQLYNLLLFIFYLNIESQKKGLSRPSSTKKWSFLEV